mmetsp:Transcript_8340/g.20384  ORF Transcript_8340/g.20384 Transcript_8340/m.20384 type:complete len:115 (+) Transcript_8340:1238-1582(+)
MQEERRHFRQKKYVQDRVKLIKSRTHCGILVSGRGQCAEPFPQGITESYARLAAVGAGRSGVADETSYDSTQVVTRARWDIFNEIHPGRDSREDSTQAGGERNAQSNDRDDRKE